MSGGSYIKLLLLLAIHFCNTVFGNFSTGRTTEDFLANITHDVITTSNNNTTDIKQTKGANSKIFFYALPGNTRNRSPFNKRNSNLRNEIKSFFITTFVLEPHLHKRSASHKNTSNQPFVEEKVIKRDAQSVLKKIKDRIIEASQNAWETIGQAFQPLRKVIIIRNAPPWHKAMTIDAHVCDENCTKVATLNGNHSKMDRLATWKDENTSSIITNTTNPSKQTILKQSKKLETNPNIVNLKINSPCLDWFWRSLESFKSKSMNNPKMDSFLLNNNNLEGSFVPASEQTNRFSHGRKKRDSNARELEMEKHDDSDPKSNTFTKVSLVDSSSTPNLISSATNESEREKATFLNELMDLMVMDSYIPVATDKNVPYIQLEEEQYPLRTNHSALFLIVTIPTLIAIVLLVFMIYHFTKTNGLCCRMFQLRRTTSEMAATKKNHMVNVDLPPN